MVNAIKAEIRSSQPASSSANEVSPADEGRVEDRKEGGGGNLGEASATLDSSGSVDLEASAAEKSNMCNDGADLPEVEFSRASKEENGSERPI